MPGAVRGGRGRAGLLVALGVVALIAAGTSCGTDGTVVLVTVEGLDSQAMDLGVVVLLDGSVRHPFPRQSVMASLSPSQQFGVLLPAGLGGAITLEVDAYRGDCQVQTGTAPVALAGEPPIMTKVVMGKPTMCAALTLQVQGAGQVTSPDAPLIRCGPEAQCLYWLDAGRTYTLNATSSAGDAFVEWLVDDDAAGCDGQSRCSSLLPTDGHRITVAFRPLCDHQLKLNPVAGLGLGANTTLRATWGIAGQEAWAVGDQGTVARFSAPANKWDLVTVKDKANGPPIQDTWTGVWGVGSPATLFLVGRNMSAGSAYTLQGPAAVPGTGTVALVAATAQALPSPATALTGFDLTSVWAVGGSGSALKWNGGTQKFEPLMGLTGAPSGELSGAWVSEDPSHTLTAVGDNRQLFVLGGSSWTTVMATGGNAVKLLAASGSGEDVYAVGQQSSVVRLSRGSTTAVVRRVATSGADISRTLSGVWAGSGYVFAVGDASSVFCSRTGGSHWTRLPVTGSQTMNFLGVYGSGKRLWIVGQNGSTGVVVEGTLP